MIKDVAAYVWNITPFLLPSPQGGRGAGGEGLGVRGLWLKLTPMDTIVPLQMVTY
ncbi:hypothetical protein MC7420_1710 [Coleofasciculus chthonoplastes PCC 7420]|uniref:Uncharacterized protein n=1 Tax=Coleofasciculus chthonoplastes PCC 7420 TaxID=118168 RepID=B4VN11_9CYAN|nr:hypothetical protein MC7420_1710 [Coleofasciculus chthonoplastes PCC 7420]